MVYASDQIGAPEGVPKLLVNCFLEEKNIIISENTYFFNCPTSAITMENIDAQASEQMRFNVPKTLFCPIKRCLVPIKVL